MSITTNRSAEKFEVAYAAPSVEAITEFAVDTNGFKAEYGRASGGNMTFSSKSGANSPHGTAYEFLRNDAFDARTPTPGLSLKNPVLRQNQFGFVVGGPVYIPKVYDGRNRTFFFGAVEWLPDRFPEPITTTVP